MPEETINLVDEAGNRIGSIGKMEAHIKGKLHEAFSLFIFNDIKELLLQRRAEGKYHSGGLWSNTCCSHPRLGESLGVATHRRLEEEMGFDCDLKEIFSFTYKAKLSNLLVENEFDHVFIGHVGMFTKITPNLAEVSDYKWSSIPKLREDIQANPQEYTEWFKIALASPVLNSII
jgi:isopentenyl-diphosphate delta-isomerase